MLDPSTLLKYTPSLPFDDQESLTKDPLSIKKKPQLPPLEVKAVLEEILGSLFPPLEFEEEGRKVKMMVSQEQASREELDELEDELEKKLRERQARYIIDKGLSLSCSQLEKSGICPVREDLHNQLFDEIIRQCTITCPERGLLLVKVRDQIKMTLAAYQTLYHGSVIFGIRKQLQAEQGRAELENKIEDFRKKKIYLENRKIELENELDSIEKSYKEIRAIEEVKKQAELTFLKNQTKHLEAFLKNVRQNTT